MSLAAVSGFLEVVDTKKGTVQYLPVPQPHGVHYQHSWIMSIARTPFVIAKSGDDALLTCDTAGTIRKWEVEEASLADSYRNWSRMIGLEDESERIELEKNEFDPSKLDQPKIGKLDADNTPHVGGNTWAGGTGGYNTAGLGGVGGPFRLDAGHDVHQMSESAKQQVPEHILKKAREIAKKEYAKRLKVFPIVVPD